MLEQGKNDPKVVLPTSPEITIEAWQKKYWAEHPVPGQSVESLKDVEECHQMPPLQLFCRPKLEWLVELKGNPRSRTLLKLHPIETIEDRLHL